MRQFFRDAQEWGWIPRRFDPTRVLATSRSVKALIGPAPRLIAAEITRLPSGCVRWQPSSEAPQDPVGLLDVPGG